MMNQEERKGQRLYERDFARERREELLPFLEKIVKELKSSDQDVDTIQQLLYDATPKSKKVSPSKNVLIGDYFMSRRTSNIVI